MDNNFIHESDVEIREWVSENLLKTVNSLQFYDERFSVFDGEYISKKGKKRFIEIKNRHFNHNHYKTTDINKDKYLEMTSTSCDLIICFDDGVLYYTPKQLIKNLYKFTEYPRKDQYDALNNKWGIIKEKMACLNINEEFFFPYFCFNSSPTRKIIPSKYSI